jgi:hypothetical protein
MLVCWLARERWCPSGPNAACATRALRQDREAGEGGDDICTLRAAYWSWHQKLMDLLADLESGTLASPTASVGAEVEPLCAEVARQWAVALQLRPGSARGPPPSALVPVVATWAAGKGLHGPDATRLAVGLTWAGLRRRLADAKQLQRVALHPADSAKLWRLVRAAWAPARAPGDQRGLKRTNKRRRGLKRTLTPRPAPPQPFHEAVRNLHHSARPLLDSLGRVWPSPSVAARALRGNPKALGNSLAWLRAALEGPPVDSRPLLEALKRKGHWRGVWWRYLTPEEVAAVPEGHMVGAPLRPYRWGLACECGGHGSAP